MDPLISVVLPVYNSASFLKEAIDSVLNQTLGDFELLIYNDGSTDGSEQVLNTYTDPRIRIINFSENKGLIKVLNTAFKEARGKYIARMDADDISMPGRFEDQVAFMDRHPECGVCGAHLSIIGSGKIISKPCSDNELRWWIFRGSPLAHPTVMIRTSVIRDHNLSFNTSAYVAEDFDLWWHLAFHARMANLDKVLLQYRIHPAQESSAKTETQNLNHRKSLVEFMETIGLNTDIFTPEYVNDMLSRNTGFNPAGYRKMKRFFGALISSESALRFFGRENIINKWEEEAVFHLGNMQEFNLSLFKDVSAELLKKSGNGPLPFAIKCIINWKTR